VHFLAGVARLCLPLITLAEIDREVVAQPLSYFHLLLPCNACCLAALYLAFPTLLHLPFVLAGRQVDEHCGGTGTLVPRARHEHVVNMGRRGHACLSNLVAQTSQGPLSLISVPVLLQPAFLLSLTLVRAAKRVPYHVLVTGMLRVMDNRVVSRGICFTLGNPALQPSYFTMVNTASPAHVSLCS
jgi:hypothetical protein